jgi:hypothetical protein
VACTVARPVRWRAISLSGALEQAPTTVRVCSGAGDGRWRPELASTVERAASGRGAVQSIP